MLEDEIGVWTITYVFHSSLECCWVHLVEYAMRNMLKWSNKILNDGGWSMYVLTVIISKLQKDNIFNIIV